MQVKISDSIKYIGVDDKAIDLFESQYLVPNGISYNSYLIVDEKVAIMDTVDKRKTDEWLENLDRELNGRTPDYLVISHLEPDHASNIKVVSEKYPSMKLVGNAKTFSMLPQFFPDFDFADKTVTVKEGDELELGSHKLTFIMAPMVHWPEVMVSYESAEKVLFSADGFGTFGALDAQEDDWACEARRYYFNICGKYGVGKSTLLNTLLPQAERETSAISQKLGRGRHTTREVTIFEAFGGRIADTPGFASLEANRAGFIPKENLEHAFPEFGPYLGQCQFTGCSHRTEKGCAIRAALAEGKLSQTRYDSYCAMYEEVKDVKDWQRRGM